MNYDDNSLVISVWQVKTRGDKSIFHSFISHRSNFTSEETPSYASIFYKKTRNKFFTLTHTQSVAVERV